ncbi:CASP-like protein 5A2 isoform X1 [Silene latifolia]|uniref:CASP-like protein 5A2 isoform X1 n=1 Tax=Silene latifolia TaxID=37657 RepID=UPI003D778253
MMSRPAVHPVEAPPLSIDNGGVDGAAPPRLRMKDFQGMPGTPGGLVLRLFQSFFAIAALLIMATTSDFPSVTAFRYLVAAAGLQIMWSLSLAVVDLYAILVKRSFRSYRVISLFAAGDGVFVMDGVTYSRTYAKVKKAAICCTFDFFSILRSPQRLYLRQPVLLQGLLSSLAMILIAVQKTTAFNLKLRQEWPS